MSKLSMENWGEEQMKVAQSEGWDLFTINDPTDPVQLQVINFPEEWDTLDYSEPKFNTDEEVWLYVRARAEQGSQVHQLALDILSWVNPSEHSYIMEHGE